MVKMSKKQRETLENGRLAFQAGITADACPFEDGTDEFEQWNADWDAAADEAQEANRDATQDDFEEQEEGDGEEPADKSVVKEEYRARYAEMGHPSHCGDELAILLNNLCLTKKGIDMPRFEHICEANGVDLSKYNRTSKGWQGRLRMTGRNLLAAKVFSNGGVLKTVIVHEDVDGQPVAPTWLEGAEAEYKMSGEWMTSRRKPKSDANG